MKIAELELRTINLPLVRPFRTSFGTQTAREVLILKVTTTDGIIGWSECVAMSSKSLSTSGVILFIIYFITSLLPSSLAPLVE